MMCHRALRDAPFVRLGAALFAALALLVACDRTPGEASGQPSEPVDFSKHERKVFSQFGEDGILEESFRRIEPSSRYAVEFGASDGVSNSNVRNLYLEHGWSGLLIEGDPGLAEQMRENYAEALHKDPPDFMRLFDHRPQGRGDIPFEKPYLEFGELRIEKKFLFDR